MDGILTMTVYFDCIKSKGFNFIRLNTRGLIPKLDALRILAANSKVAVCFSMCAYSLAEQPSLSTLGPSPLWVPLHFGSLSTLGPSPLWAPLHFGSLSTLGSVLNLSLSPIPTIAHLNLDYRVPKTRSFGFF